MTAGRSSPGRHGVAGARIRSRDSSNKGDGGASLAGNSRNHNRRLRVITIRAARNDPNTIGTPATESLHDAYAFAVLPAGGPRFAARARECSRDCPCEHAWERSGVPGAGEGFALGRTAG